ncbi:MAG: ABC transporter substrate-binding protein [Desertimonas sp.]
MRSKLWATAAAAVLATSLCGANISAREPATPGVVENANPVQPSGTLRYSFYILPTSYDPHRSTNSYDFIGLALVYDRLIHLTPQGQPVPGLATEWTFSDDGLSLELTIRAGVTFHDGEPLTADAVKASLDRALSLEGSTAAQSLSTIESVEVAGPDTVALTLTQPNAGLPLLLADRAGMIISPAALDNADLDTAPVGTGMFELSELRPAELATYTAYDGYWDPDAVRVERVEYRQHPDLSTALNAIRAGELDVAPIEPANIDLAEQAGLEIVSGPTISLQGIQVNRSIEPFDDVRVRQAILLAIDEQALIEGLFDGRGTPAGQLFNESSNAYNPEVGSDPYPYDPDRARALLDEAGLGDGFEMELIASTIPAHQSLAAAVQAQLADVGITVTVRSLAPADVNETAYVRQELITQLTFPATLDPGTLLRDYFGIDSFRNPGRASTPEILAAMDAADLPGEGHDAALQAASAIAVEQALVMPLVFPDGNYAVAPTVEDFQHWTTAKPEFRGVAVAGS